MDDKREPLIYSCSGCSSAAQAANSIALRLDRLKVGEMSCIAGVGGDVTPLVQLAKSGRRIVALDGCELKCAAHCLERHKLKPEFHYVLSRFGVKKKAHADFDPEQAEELAQKFAEDLSKQLKD